MSRVIACLCGGSEVEVRNRSVNRILRTTEKGLTLTTAGYLCNGCRHYLGPVPASREGSHA